MVHKANFEHLARIIEATDDPEYISSDPKAPFPINYVASGFSVSWTHHPCGTPSCMVGHAALQALLDRGAQRTDQL